METLLYWDGQILLWIQETLRTHWLTPIMQAVTFLGEAGWFWIALAAVLCCFRPTRRGAIAAAIGLLLSLLVNNLILKPLVHRTRPYEVLGGLVNLAPPPADASFPSGHAGASFAASTAMFPHLKRRWGVCLMVLAVLIALSRLYLGVHFPTDVAAGALIGVVLGMVGSRLSCRFPDRWCERR